MKTGTTTKQQQELASSDDEDANLSAHKLEVDSDADTVCEADLRTFVEEVTKKVDEVYTLDFEWFPVKL